MLIVEVLEIINKILIQIYLELRFILKCCHYAPAIKWHLVFAFVILSLCHSVPSKFVFLTPPTSLHGFEWNLVQMLYHKSRKACGEIIHVWNILAELRILACLLYSSYILAWIWMKLAGMLHYKSRSACGEIIHVWNILAELWPFTLRIFTHFSFSVQVLLHPCMDLNATWKGYCTQV